MHIQRLRTVTNGLESVAAQLRHDVHPSVLVLHLLALAADTLAWVEHAEQYQVPDALDGMRR